MKITIANQKGGAGKTTHCMLFANYLTLEKSKEVLVLDLDFQSTIKATWDEDREKFDNDPLYEVLDLDLDQSAALKKKLENVNGYCIIDLPGKMDDDNLVPVYQNSDLVICPMKYDRKTFKATHVFAQVVKAINPNLPIVFLPNEIDSRVKYLNKVECDTVLSEFGVMAPPISRLVAYERIDTLDIPEGAKPELFRAYDFIYENYVTPVHK